MNKYASGYALIQFLSAVGWIVIVVSAFGGLFIGFTAPRDMGWTGLLVAFAGGFQGLLLLGISALGTAVLDGANSEATSVELLKLLVKNTKSDAISSVSPEDNLDFAKPVPAGHVKIKHYKGNVILRGPTGITIDGSKGLFKNVIEAERHIDAMQ